MEYKLNVEYRYKQGLDDARNAIVEMLRHEKFDLIKELEAIKADETSDEREKLVCMIRLGQIIKWIEKLGGLTKCSIGKIRFP